MNTQALIKAKKAEREAKGLKVTILDTNFTGYFKDEASRDDFVARAKLNGQQVKIG